MTDDLLNPVSLAIDMLKECDRWACHALVAYVHKEHLFQMDLSVETVSLHQQKIRIVIDIRKIKRC
jgi:hypothetical protein